jgi:hypothetical protein
MLSDQPPELPAKPWEIAMTIRSKSTMINRVSVALIAVTAIGSVIAGSTAPAAATESGIARLIAVANAKKDAANQDALAKTTNHSTPTTARAPGGTTTVSKIGGGVHKNLTTSDCRTILGGTVITPGDDRCGVGGQYCRTPDGLAACIDERK